MSHTLLSLAFKVEKGKIFKICHQNSTSFDKAIFLMMLLQSIIKFLLCTGALHYVPYSFSLFSNTFCFSGILDFSMCIIFHICTSADMKYYACVLWSWRIFCKRTQNVAFFFSIYIDIYKKYIKHKNLSVCVVWVGCTA